jgi:hypothetical protein
VGGRGDVILSSGSLLNRDITINHSDSPPAGRTGVVSDEPHLGSSAPAARLSRIKKRSSLSGGERQPARDSAALTTNSSSALSKLALGGSSAGNVRVVASGSFF